MSAAVAASMAVATFPAPAWASAYAVPSALVASATATAALDPASVLGLEGDDAKANEALTTALRAAFKTRGYAGGEEISLAELRLSMGCEGNDEKCLAEGGDALGVTHLVYGTLNKSGGEYTIKLQILNVEDGIVEKETTLPVKKKDLSPDRIDATAEEIVATLLPSEDSGDLPPVTTAAGPPTGDDPGNTADEPKRDSKYEWGPYSPRPTWKKAGLGVGAGLAVAGLAAALIFGVPALRSTQRKGRLYDDLVASAEASLVDDEKEIAAGSEPGFNDVDPAIVQEICSDKAGSGGALEVVGATMEGKPAVRNATVAQECRKGEAYATAGNIGWAVFAVGTVTTMIFTTLMFVHKKGDDAGADPDDDSLARQRRRSIRIGASPASRGRGLIFGGGMRF